MIESMNGFSKINESQFGFRKNSSPNVNILILLN